MVTSHRKARRTVGLGWSEILMFSGELLIATCSSDTTTGVKEQYELNNVFNKRKF